MHGINRLDDGKPKTKQGNKLDLARAVLVSEGVLTQAESDELKKLVDYRNLIGHQIHDLTVDVGAYADLTRHCRETFKPLPHYKDSAAQQASRPLKYRPQTRIQRHRVALDRPFERHEGIVEMHSAIGADQRAVQHAF